jgi:Clostripain family
MRDERDLAAESGGNSATQFPIVAKWGIYVYFAADIPNRDLQAAVWTTLRTIASVGSSDTVKITAMVDLPHRHTEYYIFPQRPLDKSTIRWTVMPDRFLSNVNSASIEAILDFFDWSNRNCPAEKTALIFWGHGYALDDFDPRSQQKSTSTAQTCFDKQRAANSFPGERGDELKLLYDVTHNSVLNNRDFADAIRKCTQIFTPPRKIQVVGLDCCNMAMAEVLSELQGSADFAVAAETGLPFQAWLSAPVLRKFLNASNPSAMEFAETAVQDFIGSFSHSVDQYIELSACDLKKFGALEAAMKKLVGALLPAIDQFKYRRAISQAWYDDVSFVPDGLIDLASFCTLLQKYIDKSDPVAVAAAQVQTAVKLAVPCAKASPDLKGRRIALSQGLSFWFPPWIQFPGVRYAQIRQSKDYLFNGYSGTHFAKVTGWDRFLRKLFYLTQMKPDQEAKKR